MKTHYLVTKAGIHLFIELIFVLSLSRFPFIDQVKQFILFLKLSFGSLQITSYKVYDEYFMALSDTYGNRIMSFLPFLFLRQGPIIKCTLTWGNKCPCFHTCKCFVAWDNSLGLLYQYYLFWECEEKILLEVASFSKLGLPDVLGATNMLFS